MALRKKRLHPVLSTVLLGMGLCLILLLVGCEKSNDALKHNHTKEALPFKLGTVQCPQCRMPVELLNNAVQVVKPDGNTYIFDDVGCMILWAKENKYNFNTLVSWVYAHDSHHWIDAKKAYYSLTDSTPMRYGFGAYEKPHADFINFEEMRLRMLRGLTLKDPKIRKHLLGN